MNAFLELRNDINQNRSSSVHTGGDTGEAVDSFLLEKQALTQTVLAMSEEVEFLSKRN